MHTTSSRNIEYKFPYPQLNETEKGQQMNADIT